MGKGHRTCEVCGIRERHEENSLLFSSFPLEPNRCREWLRVVGKEDLVYLPIEKLHKTRNVCADHFEKKHFNKKGNRLKRNAIPTLNLMTAPLAESHFKEFPQHLYQSTEPKDVLSEAEPSTSQQGRSILGELSQNGRFVSADEGRAASEAPGVLKMRCCAPFCRNALDNVGAPGGDGRCISFHSFPSDARLRAAWLSALGRQGAPLPDPAVVCSQHFLDDDIHETESGSRLIGAGAIPSTVLVCMMCLDTDSRMFLMTKHKLEEAYEYLTGYAPCNQGNLKQTLCVQCAQRLMNFSRLRDQSLRARALLMELVEKHELITRLHIKMINRTKHRLKSPMVVTNLGADFCDLHIQEDTSDDEQTESETIINEGVVKIEEIDDPLVIIEDMDVIYEDDDYADDVNNDFVGLHEANVSDLLKFESADFKCWLCSEEFVQEHAYREHMIMHAQSGSAAGASGTTGACELRAAVGAGRSLPSLAEIKPDPAGLHDGRAPAGVAHTSVAPLSCVAISNDGEELSAEAAGAGPSSEQAVTIINDNLDYRSADSDSRINDNIDRYTYSIVNLDDGFGKKHIQSHTTVNRFTCEICQYKYKYKFLLTRHMRTHTGEKSYSCKFCEYQSTRKSNFLVHMRKHTGEKPYSCKLCECKFSHKCNMEVHMRTHTGEKPFSCGLLYKTATKSGLTLHMKTH